MSTVEKASQLVKSPYPSPPHHSPRFNIIDGRHRYAAAVWRGMSELRCDVITASGHALRIIPVRELAIDPDVQIQSAFRERWARRIERDWSDRLAGVLTVTPLNGGESLLPEEKAEIKLGLDRDRRHVSAMESFHVEIERKDPIALEILEVATETGWEIDKVTGSSPPNRIGSIVFLKRSHAQIGKQGLRRALGLAAHWRKDPKANDQDWLGAFALLVRDGYDEQITDRTLKYWMDVVPAEEIRRARGASVKAAGGGRNSAGDVAYLIAGQLCKRGRLRKRPTKPGNRPIL